MYKGLILKESLDNATILEDSRITVAKEKIWNVGKRAVDWQPDTWTAVYVEGADTDVTEIAELISNSILDKWYANLSDSIWEYVIFHKKVFSYKKGDKNIKQQAQKYGKSIGVPEHQLDW